VFENGVLGRIFEPRREEISRYLRRVHNIDHYQVYYGDQIKAHKTGGTCRTHERDEHCVHIFYKKSERKIHIGELRVNVKIILK
jgi:hypothetical protein